MISCYFLVLSAHCIHFATFLFHMGSWEYYYQVNRALPVELILCFGFPTLVFYSFKNLTFVLLNMEEYEVLFDWEPEVSFDDVFRLYDLDSHVSFTVIN